MTAPTPPPEAFVEAFTATVDARRSWLNLPDFDTDHPARHKASDLYQRRLATLHRELVAWVVEATA